MAARARVFVFCFEMAVSVTIRHFDLSPPGHADDARPGIHFHFRPAAVSLSPPRHPNGRVTLLYGALRTKRVLSTGMVSTYGDGDEVARCSLESYPCVRCPHPFIAIILRAYWLQDKSHIG
jgi:hypothetical protein